MNRYTELYHQLRQWLLDYIANVGCTNGGCRQAFDLKRRHSLKVAEEMTRIGGQLGLPEQDLFLARTIGLLHDVGRFEQYKTYGTFNDFASIDHGELGGSIVAGNGVLGNFDAAQREIIVKAIRYHNKMSLPIAESEAVLLHTKLIRDADKLDIYRVVTERAVVPGTLPLHDTISESLLDDLAAGKAVDYKRLKNSAEMRLMHINWVFDINFDPTRRLVLERNYLDVLSAMLPPGDKIEGLIRKARARLLTQIPPAP